MQPLTAVWSIVRWAIVAVVVGGGVWLFLGMLLHEPDPENIPSWLWYGNWRAVLITTGLFTLFLLGFARPRRRGEWRDSLALFFSVRFSSQLLYSVMSDLVRQFSPAIG